MGSVDGRTKIIGLTIGLAKRDAPDSLRRARRRTRSDLCLVEIIAADANVFEAKARRRVESSRFLVSKITGFLSKCLMRSKSSARNSGHPVPTTSASEPSAAEYAESQ